MELFSGDDEEDDDIKDEEGGGLGESKVGETEAVKECRVESRWTVRE